MRTIRFSGPSSACVNFLEKMPVIQHAHGIAVFLDSLQTRLETRQFSCCLLFNLTALPWQRHRKARQIRAHEPVVRTCQPPQLHALLLSRSSFSASRNCILSALQIIGPPSNSRRILESPGTAAFGLPGGGFPAGKRKEQTAAGTQNTPAAGRTRKQIHSWR